MNHQMYGLSSAAFVAILLASPAPAQSVTDTFEGLSTRVKGSERIFVTDQNGRTVEGSLTTLTASTLGVWIDGNPRTWARADVREVRRRDSLSNGMGIGAGVGVGVGLVAGTLLGSLFSNEGRDGSSAVLGLTALGLGAGIGLGAAVDAAIRGPVLFRDNPARVTIKLQPLISKSAKGLHVAIPF